VGRYGQERSLLQDLLDLSAKLRDFDDRSMATKHVECWGVKNQWMISENSLLAYFSGLGIAVPTVFCGATPALDKA
jgi:hypothetical protein